MRRMRLFSVFVCVSTVLGGMATAGTAAASAAPSNDAFANATVVPSLPFSDTVDTTGAHDGPADAQLNASNPNCTNPFGPVLSNSVWYKFTAGTDGALGVDASRSSYFVGVEIATGTPGALTAVSCGIFTATTPTVPGTTYYVNAFDLFGDGGGTLNIDFFIAPTLSVTASGGTADRSGAATITFVYTCTRATTADGYMTLTQAVGRTTILGDLFFSADANCDGSPHTWSATIPAFNGKFAGGKAVLTADIEVCAGAVCGRAPTLTQTVQLRRSGA
jgi:hypothetical protein